MQKTIDALQRNQSKLSAIHTHFGEKAQLAKLHEEALELANAAKDMMLVKAL